MAEVDSANGNLFQHCVECPNKGECSSLTRCRRNWRKTELMQRGFVDFSGMRCEEASIYSRETFIPCGQPVWGVVYHDRDKRAYMMCFGCASHNVENRRGVLIARKERQP